MSKCPCGKRKSVLQIQCSNGDCEVGWWHATCAGFNKDLSKKQLDAIQPWKCPCCVFNIINLPGYKIAASSNKASTELDESINELKQEISNLKQVKDELAAIGNKQKEAQVKWSDIAAKIPSSDTNFASNIAKQVVDHSNKVKSDRESRENNVIIFNADESTSGEAVSRKQHDQQVFNNICNHVLEQTLPVKNILRLGKRQEAVPANSDNKTAEQAPPTPRPIKVCFNNNFDKRKFLANLYKLDDATTDLKKISVKHDLSPDERQQSKELFTEAQRKNDTEKPVDFLYKVRGPPHSLRIVKVYRRE